MKIYVASSWRNTLQPAIVHALRRCGHDVYDFRHPAPGETGFSWKATGVNIKERRHTDACDTNSWRAKTEECICNASKFVTPEEWKALLATPVAAKGFALDIGALRACDAVVYVLPCGRSASWEFGYAMGQGKPGYVVAFDDTEPELMFREAKILVNMGELFEVFGEPLET